MNLHRPNSNDALQTSNRSRNVAPPVWYLQQVH